jgi:hypothetical protein
MRPGGPHMPNYFVPVVQQGQQGLHPGIRRSGAGDHGQQPAQSFQHQVFFYRISCYGNDCWPFGSSLLLLIFHHALIFLILILVCWVCGWDAAGFCFMMDY